MPLRGFMMNDFTKEELEILKILAESKESLTGNKPYQYLADKIKFMIKNYHECVFDMQEYCTGCGRYKSHE